MKPTRRQILIATACALAGEPASARGTTPRPRSHCYFGLHFDLHPTPDDEALGADVTESMIEGLLRAAKPDFVQYDSKGHPGYLGFPSKTGMSAPHIARDSLEIWRRVTARNNVALYNHFSGVLDGFAIQKHPEWARIGPHGEPSEQETSLFSGYEQQLMIPELEEVAEKYQLDGSWVDGDCWAVEPDYCAASVAEFRAKTGFVNPPRKAGDPGWNEFLELQRERFRRYVENYVNALHSARPGYQITSNWMYSTFVPEQPVIPLDYLSGDIADQAPVRRARVEARYFGACGKTWDLMSWGFENDPHFGHMSDKPALALEQEAAIVLAQGGAYQIYYTPTRRGRIDQRVIHVCSEVAQFCRSRQELSHRSETVPEAAVLFSRRSLYNNGTRVFGPWGKALGPLEGALDVLIACRYSVDVLPDWKPAEAWTHYPLLVVPDWRDLGDEQAQRLADYAANGGKLILCGAENAALFAPLLKFRLAQNPFRADYYVAGESGFAAVAGSWAVLEEDAGNVLARAFRTLSTEGESVPLGVRLVHGKGAVIVCPGPLMSEYAEGRTPILRDAVRQLANALYRPAVLIEGEFPALELVLRRKNGSLLIHLINLANAPVTGEFRHPGVVPLTGPLTLSVRLASAPARAMVAPHGVVVRGEYRNGQWRGTIPSVHVHTIVQFEGAAL